GSGGGRAYPHQLSQGEAQRAAIARAIVNTPPLLIADEPTGSLDDDIALEILEVIRDIWSRGTTVLFATHQARLVSQLGRRTLRLEAGRPLQEEGGSGAPPAPAVRPGPGGRPRVHRARAGPRDGA